MAKSKASSKRSKPELISWEDAIEEAITLIQVSSKEKGEKPLTRNEIYESLITMAEMRKILKVFGLNLEFKPSGRRVV
jgi:hypothetical protein